jgi:hypothetical protein
MIPNLIKGSGISGAIRYAMGEGNDEETGKRKQREPGQRSRTEILGGQNFPFEIDSAERVELARRMMEYQALPENQSSKTRKCENDCLHLSLSWNPGETPDRAEMIEAAQGVLKALGMERARALFFAHHDTEHRHMHIVASRIDPETGKTFAEARGDYKIAQEWALQWEKAHNQISPARAKIHKIREAVQERNADRLLELLTDYNPTFTGRELNKAIGYGGLPKAEADTFHKEVMAHRAIVALRDETVVDGKAKTVPRFTTRAVIDEERAVLATAGRLDAREGFRISDRRRDAAAATYTLTAEQRAALDHVTGSNGFAMIAGEAGTGKSQTLKAVRSAYEAAGFKVIGMAWTNKVVADMRQDGFAQASTIAAEIDLFGHFQPGKRPCDRWDGKTVLVVDEAAQLSTRALGAVMARADAAGAKLIAVGDDKQFASIERGGLFELLRRDGREGGFGAAKITEVQRVKDLDQRKVWGLMHEGDFRPALELFERQGALNWTRSQKGAADALMARYTADVAASPDKDRFIFAATNDEVRSLNALARQLARDTGRLGDHHALAATAGGPLEIATGDRLQLNTNGRTKAEKAQGLVKDAVGTVTRLENTETGKLAVTLRFDVAKGKEAKEARFVVGADREAGEINAFSRGYAGTSYKGQGRSIEQVYVLHSSQWRASASYVSLTRHKESVAVFASKETVTEAEPWMMETGGFDALKGHHRGSARESYAVWAEEKPALAARYDLPSYVGYVQEKWARENTGKTDLERLAQLMGRDDAKHAALSYEIEPGQAVQAKPALAAPQQGAEPPEPSASPASPAPRPSPAGHPAALPEVASDPVTPAADEERRAALMAKAKRFGIEIGAEPEQERDVDRGRGR